MNRAVELQSPVAFHLTGKRSGPELASVTEQGLRPALFARYRDLGALRYDFPAVLVPDASDGHCVVSLTALVERALEADKGPDAVRLRAHALRIEREIRVLAAAEPGSLAELLDQAAKRVCAAAPPQLADSLKRLRAKLPLHGTAIDCDVRLPWRLIEHAWREAQKEKIATHCRDIERLVHGLEDILRADEARSPAARSAASLRAGMGSIHDDSFDFDAMSRLLGASVRGTNLSARRRERIERTLKALRAQRFYPVVRGVEPYPLRFTDCAGALRAFRERVPEMARLARAITVARLEIDGAYSEPRHDALFEQLGASGLELRDLALFPDCLVCLNTATLGAADLGELLEILASGLPMKIVVQSDDILEPPLVEAGHLAFGARSRQLAHMAMSLNDVFVLQASASHLVRSAESVQRAMRHRGPALFSVYSGAQADTGGLPAYLNAAAAAESRAFPAFTYDPGAGKDWASRFALDANPQVERDWPQHVLEYEDAEHQRCEEKLAFTLLDYVACDRRFAEHFAKVPRAQWGSSLAPASECLDAEYRGLPDRLPALTMIDGEDRLQRVIVDERLLGEARRCRELWRSLQELGGIGNSHAARALEQAKAEAQAQAAQGAPAAAAPAAAPASAAVPTAAAASVAAAPAEPARNPDEPYIETPRCSSCNECIQLNGRMFAYDSNNQARIVDLAAGTYRELVEAAERCQVAVIHPGKPKNPNEPGLEELLKRAEAFA